MSEHDLIREELSEKLGYTVNERFWDKKVFDDIWHQGIDHALSVHDRLDVLKAIGGEEYGAKITDDTVAFVHWFDNSGLPYSSIKDLRPAMDSVGITFVHTIVYLALIVPRIRVSFSRVSRELYLKAVENGVERTHTKLTDYEADPNWSSEEIAAIRAEYSKIDAVDPDAIFDEELRQREIYWGIRDALISRGFIQRG